MTRITTSTFLGNMEARLFFPLCPCECLPRCHYFSFALTNWQIHKLREIFTRCASSGLALSSALAQKTLENAPTPNLSTCAARPPPPPRRPPFPPPTPLPGMREVRTRTPTQQWWVVQRSVDTTAPVKPVKSTKPTTSSKPSPHPHRRQVKE